MILYSTVVENFHVMGNDLYVMMAAQAGQLELNVMMPVIAYNLFQMMDILIRQDSRLHREMRRRRPGQLREDC